MTRYNSEYFANKRDLCWYRANKESFEESDLADREFDTAMQWFRYYCNKYAELCALEGK